jgi:hypothetical protein
VNRRGHEAATGKVRAQIDGMFPFTMVRRP